MITNYKKIVFFRIKEYFTVVIKIKKEQAIG